MPNGPRPWPIRLFAALFLGSALARLARDLGKIDLVMIDLAKWLPPHLVTPDSAIMWSFAQLTIACIPVALIWSWASRLARVLVGVMVGLSLGTIPDMLFGWQVHGVLDPLAPVLIAASLLGAGLLFTPPAQRWFELRGGRKGDAIE